MNQAPGTTEGGAGPAYGRHTVHVRPSLTVLAALTLATAGFLAGRLTAAPAVPPAPVATGGTPSIGERPAAEASLLVQAPGDPRELIPLPRPGEAEGVPEECLLLYEDGELYRFGDPGPGDGEPGPRELIPLEPFRRGPGGPGPNAPRQPAPPSDPPGTLRAHLERPTHDRH